MLSAAFLKALLATLPDLVWLKDPAGVYLACNAPFAGYVGLPVEAIVGKTDAELPLGERAAALRVAAAEQWLDWPDGGPRRMFQISTEPVCADDGAPIGTLGIGRELTALYEARAALHASEAHYHTLFQTMVQGVVYQSADGQIIDANPAACAILGLSEDQLAGRSSFDLRWTIIHEDGSPFPGETHPAIEALRTGRPVRDVVMGVLNQHSATYTWIRVNAVPQFGPGAARPTAVYVTFEDITAPRAAQEELEGYRRHLEELVAERTAAVEQANRRLRLSDRRLQALLDLSQRAGELSEAEVVQLGVNEAVRLTESAIGYLHLVNEDQETIELLAWSDGARTQCTAAYDSHYPVSLAGIWADTVRTRAPVIHNDYQHLPERHGYPAGHARVVRHLGVPIIEGERVRLLLGVGNKATDYTETDLRELLHIGADLWRIVMRRRAEEGLRESEARYRALFESSIDAIAVLDSETGQFSDCNQAAVELYDLDGRAAIVGRRPEDFSPPLQPAGGSSAALVRHYIAQTLASGSVVFEWTHRKGDGSPIPTLMSLSVVQLRGRTHVLAVGRDISELKRYQQALEQARDDAEAANRAKSAFLANMSHELRTPLSAILGRTELLREQIYGPLAERQIAALASIEASGTHLLELINDILDLSKVEAGQIELRPELLDLYSVAAAALQLVSQAAAERRLDLSLSTDGVVTSLSADPRRLRQILLNLLSNAVKFTPEGGKVGIEIAGDPGGGRALLTVWDTGIGIEAAELPRLFRPFVQLDTRLSRQYEGSGLGLALVLCLTELHGGSVSVESSPARGSRFTVILPWAGEPAAPPDALPPAPALEPAPSGARRVLLVDDNLASLQLLLDYLPLMGLQIAVAHDGAEAVAQARRLRPDLILMDIQMPVVDGLTATRQIRAIPELQATPIVALTALVMPGDHERCLAAGADVYLAKPVALRVLRETITTLLGLGA